MAPKHWTSYPVMLLILALSGLLFSACGSRPDSPSLNTLLKLDAKRLTFVYFFTPG